MVKIIPRPPRQVKECKICKRIRWFVIAAVVIIIIAKTNPAGLKALEFVTTDNLARIITGLLGLTIAGKILHWHFIGRHDFEKDDTKQETKETTTIAKPKQTKSKKNKPKKPFMKKP